MSGIIIGLAGRRGVGKTKVADHLVANHGFERLHPFQGGKVACVGYFKHIGADEETAQRMVNGDLKDVASPLLPDQSTPRFFMEKFGQFMGVQMGPDWTIGREMKRILDEKPDARLVAESIVYEAGVLRDFGGHIVRISRDSATVDGIETDAATAAIQADAEFQNNGSCLEELAGNFDALLTEIGAFQADAEPDLA